MEQLFAVAPGVDLTGQIGRLLRRVPGAIGVGLNTDPGSASVGVLKQIMSAGGAQIAVVAVGQSFRAVTAAPVTKFTPLTNDASGRAVAAGPGDIVSGYALRNSTGIFVDVNLAADDILVDPSADRPGLRTMGRYWVAPANVFPPAPYNTPQAANDAAVANGHGPTKPAVIFLLPGTYAGNVTLSDGIALHGFGIPDSIGDTTIVGVVTAVSTASSTLSQFSVLGRLVLGAGGATAASYTVQSVTVIPAAPGDVPLTMSDTTARFMFISCTFDGTTSIANAVEIAVVANIISFDSCELLAPVTNFALHTASSVTSLDCEDVLFRSGISYGGVVTARIGDSGFEMTAGHPIVTSFAGSSTRLHVCDVTGLATGDVLIAGTGSVFIDSITGVAAFTIAPTITGAQLFVQRIYSDDAPPGGANVNLISLADMVRVQNGGGGAGFSVMLPSTKTIIQGTRSVIRNIGAASVMTIKADTGTPGDTIDGGASVLLVPPANSCEIQLKNQNWTSFSKQ